MIKNVIVSVLILLITLNAQTEKPDTTATTKEPRLINSFTLGAGLGFDTGTGGLSFYLPFSQKLLLGINVNINLVNSYTDDEMGYFEVAPSLRYVPMITKYMFLHGSVSLGYSSKYTIFESEKKSNSFTGRVELGITLTPLKNVGLSFGTYSLLSRWGSGVGVNAGLVFYSVDW